MTTLRFIPIFEDKKFLDACTQYDIIWKNDGASILETFKEIIGLELQEERIAALVYEGMSFSGRDQNDTMKLRASYTDDVKKGTLIHELGHRLVFDIKTQSSEEEHKFLNLFLYDVWDNLYGKEFAASMVEVESERNDMYRRAWKYALSMNYDQRQKLLHEKLIALKY